MWIHGALSSLCVKLAHYSHCCGVRPEWVKDSKTREKKKRISAGEPLCCDESMSCLCACVYVRSRPCSVLDGDVEEHYTTAIPLGPLHAEGHSCSVTWNMVQSALYDQSLPPLSSFRVVWRAWRFTALTFFVFWSVGKSVPVETCPLPWWNLPPPSLFSSFPLAPLSHTGESRGENVLRSCLCLFFFSILIWSCTHLLKFRSGFARGHRNMRVNIKHKIRHYQM